MQQSGGPSGQLHLTAHCRTAIGGRKAQEDRFTVCPTIGEDSSSAFFGVFDGTVGDFASHNIQHLVLPAMLQSQHWEAFRAMKGSAAPGAKLPPQQEQLLLKHLELCAREGFAAADEQLIAQIKQTVMVVTKSPEALSSVTTLLSRVAADQSTADALQSPPPKGRSLAVDRGSVS